ncbi:MAG: tRNA preQ1(34) S-adenosylmethionine ribosyltransferase-isomerase QueA [Gammaproteobacteria bacterium]|nr:tRNA preQ1(34) S-adenosylmethionine ribosyltransferase-isomerase QueA [Gammaproteobacteria bacterium]MYG14696.1 tRNA preQ1(34) S-adenosylmethionine ribosyltransferase-isomerase QueA [Gammaproteobacteria bacterium]MYK29711.1 tRNA preQ1(34) S-adenosylmethionine ribosyltransferase-isomerase QueA [Gammaproteobacteria bacterium]
MLKSDFAYDLPAELIAQQPLAQRDQARLLHLGRDRVTHRTVADWPELLSPDDLVVVNNTKVIPARLQGVKDSGGAVELLVERIEDERTALCQARASKPLKPGRWLSVGGERLELVARVGEFHRLRFPQPVMAFLQRHGTTPLPPYIDRAAEAADEGRYQTLYASAPGAVAAPTAGLHFSERLLDEVRRRVAGIVEVTLHIGAGTFAPMRGDDLDAHQMHAERYEISTAAAEQIRAAAQGPGRIVAVGTTVVRALETAGAEPGGLRAGRGETRLFIKPGFRFSAVDALLTNFHLPESTLLMLVCAFAGQRRVLQAYRSAVAAGYRFFSYGDAMFTERLADV